MEYDKRIIQGDHQILFKGDLGRNPMGCVPSFAILIIMLWISLFYTSLKLFLVSLTILIVIELIGATYKKRKSNYYLWQKDNEKGLWLHISNDKGLNESVKIDSLKSWYSYDFSIDFQEKTFIQKHFTGRGPKVSDERRVHYLFLELQDDSGRKISFYEKKPGSIQAHWPHKKMNSLNGFLYANGLNKLKKFILKRID